MKSYKMDKFTVIAPSVTNAREHSGYPDAFADLLDELEQNYTRHAEHIGSWNGWRELGEEFEILALRDGTFSPELLAHAAREAMPDQDAIQIVYHGTVTVWEA